MKIHADRVALGDIATIPTVQPGTVTGRVDMAYHIRYPYPQEGILIRVVPDDPIQTYENIVPRNMMIDVERDENDYVVPPRSTGRRATGSKTRRSANRSSDKET